MIPLRDVIPSRTFPIVTIGFIAANAAVFYHQLTLPEPALEQFIRTYGLVPAEFSLLHLVTSMFLHGGWVHFLGNMLYLWIFGDNVEDMVGHGRFISFYVLCGAAAALSQVAADPGSTLPMVGASGAIAGVLGAYLILFPHSRVLTLIPVLFFLHLIEIRAIWFLGLWFVLQLLGGLEAAARTAQEDVGGVAFWAHVAGFIAGAALIFVFRRPERRRIQWWDK